MAEESAALATSSVIPGSTGADEAAAIAWSLSHETHTLRRLGRRRSARALSVPCVLVLETNDRGPTTYLSSLCS